MSQYTMSQKETTLLKRLQKVLQENPELADKLRQAGLDAEHLQDPADVFYLMDAPCAKVRTPIQMILNAHLEQHQKEAGSMETQTTYTWDRCSLDALLRLLWRMRDIDGETVFMRGNAGIETPPISWRAELQWEHNRRILRCFDEDHRNFMYLVLKDGDSYLTQKEFMHEVRSFLNFSEDAVWINRDSTTQVMEVDR